MLTLLRAVATVLCCVLAAGLIIAFGDFLLRIEDAGTRWLFTLGWLAAITGAVWYFLVPVFRSKWSDKTVALWIERRFPSLANRLSSSLEFLQTGESLGSKPLMRSVINRTTTDVENLDLSQALDYRSTFNRIICAVGLALVCAILFATNTAASGKALTRLLFPFQNNPWPRVHHLVFVDPPTKVARGGDLRLALIDESAELPAHVDLEMRYEGQAKSELDVIPMQRVAADLNGSSSDALGNDHGSVEQMVFERNNVSRSFQYRAVGGDDQSMAWRTLEVVEAPQITAGQIRLAPPDYTGWQPSILAEADGGLRVIEGTKISFSGSSDRRLREARLIVANSAHTDTS